MDRRSERLNLKRRRRNAGVDASQQLSTAGVPRRVLGDTQVGFFVEIPRLSQRCRIEYRKSAQGVKLDWEEDIKIHVNVKTESLDGQPCHVKVLKSELSLDVELKPKCEDVKPKLEDSKVLLSRHDVDRHLAGLSDFPIAAAQAALPVKRKVLMADYGVHPQWVISSFSKNLDFDNAPPIGHVVLCCTAKINPALPSAPGGCGFLLSNRLSMCNREFSLFCRAFYNKRALWRYYGEYRGTHTGFLSPHEFGMQSEKVQNDWAAKIAQQKHPEYVAMRDEIQRLRGPTTITVNKSAVMAALICGDVSIGIVTLQCFGYNEHLASAISKSSHLNLNTFSDSET